MDCEEGARCSAVLKTQSKDNKGNLPQLYRYHFKSSGIFSHFSWISRAQLIQLSPPHTPMLTILKKRVKGYLKGYLGPSSHAGTRGAACNTSGSSKYSEAS